jgi:hypothetical protein
MIDFCPRGVAEPDLKACLRHRESMDAMGVSDCLVIALWHLEERDHQRMQSLAVSNLNPRGGTQNG